MAILIHVLAQFSQNKFNLKKMFLYENVLLAVNREELGVSCQ